jgi:hypothetical protein
MKPITKLALALAVSAFVLSLAPAAKADVLDTDLLGPGDTMTYTVFLRAGQSAGYIAGADEDAIDVDMFVFAPGCHCIARDVLDDTIPMVAFVAPVTGRYQIVVKLVASYGGVPCYFSIADL